MSAAKTASADELTLDLSGLTKMREFCLSRIALARG